MPHQRSRALRAGLLCAFLVAPLLCLPALAEEPPKSPRERIDREMLRLRVQIQNGRIRLAQGLVGAIGEELDPSEPVTPMRSCCEINLRKMKGAVRELTTAFDDLERCHRAEENHGGISALGFARSDLGEFSRGVQVLAEAADQEEALGTLDGLTQLYFRLQESAEAIDACPAVEPAAASPEEEKGAEERKDEPKKSKKAKKQEAEEESGG